MNSQLTGTAGEHYVVYMLSRLGYVAAVVREGSQSIDILASTLDGSYALGIQVKTTRCAGRLRGRGAERKLAELQFPLGHHALEVAEQVVFCFVDFCGDESPNAVVATPVVYVIPARLIQEEYKGVDVRQWSFFRLHRSVEWMEPYKNNWYPVHHSLGRENRFVDSSLQFISIVPEGKSDSAD